MALRLRIYAVIGLLFGISLPAAAQDLSVPVLIQADEMTQDQELGNVVARGHVEITQGERLLFADTVSYNQKSNTVTASGNVILLEPDGDTVFAEYVELTDSLREGVIQRIRVLLSDNSRFAANAGRRTNGNRTVLSKAVYSPCDVCRENPEKAPLWQLKANTIVHDKAAQEIRYKNAWMEIYGYPVLYTPYFAHPDPSVNRKSGFLTPSFGSSGRLGAFTQVPYFWAIDNNKDVTFAPILTKDEGVVFAGEYRQRFDSGSVELSGSLAEADRRIGSDVVKEIREDEIRGHIFGHARFDIDDTWRTGVDVQRSTDRSYLRTFNFFGSPGNSLESNAYIEGFRGRNYAAGNIFLFQDLHGGLRPNTPKIAPLIDFNHVGQPSRWGGKYVIDASLRSLYREDRSDVQLMSLEMGYDLPFIADAGHITTFSATLRNDLYYVEHNAPIAEDEGLTGRVFPQVSAHWRYPFVRDSGASRQLIEPIAAVILAPNGSNPGAIPSEDSTVVELDDTNILSADRFPGIDRLESGQKVVYGLNMGVFGSGDGQTTAFVGQSYRIHADDDLANQVGIERHVSNIVGRVNIRPNRYLDLLYRFRADDDTLGFKRNELEFSAGPDAFRVSSNYLFVAADPNEASLEEREEIGISASSKIDDFWTVSAQTQRDLDSNGGTLFTGMRITYEDECVILTADAERRFTRDADFDPSDTIIFRVSFKNLGAVSSQVY
ncbi:MAG: LPS assembly protein LptD [Proteobacteria bacterium]|nr:LPS assembly protein LptD [Pseudomonadota bacterium]